ncbi:MAG: DUF1501 domain-containing protein [Planctomycetota bacterium]
MPDPKSDAFTRRLFLRQGLTLASMMSTTPWFLEQTAHGVMTPLDALTSSRPGVPEDHVLVVVQLGGGNDGLNTVVPYGDRMYNTLRPQLAIPAPGRTDSVLSLDDSAGIGLNPGLASFKDLFDDGVASIIQGVGYPNPNRSHFTSMDIWHTAALDGKGDGWLGRYFDNNCNGTPEAEGMISIGREAPLAMNGVINKPVTFESSELFQWSGRRVHDSLEAPYKEINETPELDGVDPEGQLAFLLRTSMDAQVSSDRIRTAVAKQPLVHYPGGNLSDQLRVIGAMIRDGLSTRVYYASIGGFDTHANQAGTHQRLLRQVGDSLKSFYEDIKAQGNSSRVLTMVFSEFGRRVAQNASGGTDHGTAAPMYLIGDMVRPGLLGSHPSLNDLDQGDLKFTVDFRSIYATVLDDWLGASSRDVLGAQFRAANVLRGS